MYCKDSVYILVCVFRLWAIGSVICIKNLPGRKEIFKYFNRVNVLHSTFQEASGYFLLAYIFLFLSLFDPELVILGSREPLFDLIEHAFSWSLQVCITLGISPSCRKQILMVSWLLVSKLEMLQPLFNMIERPSRYACFLLR